ncbi:hypothetical protein BaRGS_00017619 [Batillaria attramentaria]|uniref:Uncharacterized protein n=1 Tax=Batillaria attramentaria TaxID=370345 RepID=A0ABD0KVQ1_9CAEN
MKEPPKMSSPLFLRRLQAYHLHDHSQTFISSGQQYSHPQVSGISCRLVSPLSLVSDICVDLWAASIDCAPSQHKGYVSYASFAPSLGAHASWSD